MTKSQKHQSPLAVEKRGPGFRVSILGSAAGLCYLSFCPKEQRDSLLELMSNSRKEEDRPARNRKKVYDSLVETRKRGFAIAHRMRRVSEELSISVPIIAEDRLLAALTFRCSSTAVPEADAVKKFVPKLKAVAQQIGQEFIDQHNTDALVSAPTGLPDEELDNA
jgi:IclR family mhp operon transcriptional activator